MNSDEKCFGCVPLETGVKAIAFLYIIKPPISIVVGIYVKSLTPVFVYSILMLELAGNLFFILVLGIKDNNTLWGRRMMTFGYFFIYVVALRTMLYSMFYREDLWGTTIPKVLC